MPKLNQWTPAFRARFLDCLAASGNVGAAAAACGLSRQSVYKLRRRDPLFAQDWDAALAALRAALDQELMQWLAGDPRFARLCQAMQVQPGRRFAPQDTVNCINPVSTTQLFVPA